METGEEKETKRGRRRYLRKIPSDGRERRLKFRHKIYACMCVHKKVYMCVAYLFTYLPTCLPTYLLSMLVALSGFLTLLKEKKKSSTQKKTSWVETLESHFSIPNCSAIHNQYVLTQGVTVLTETKIRSIQDFDSRVCRTFR